MQNHRTAQVGKDLRDPRVQPLPQLRTVEPWAVETAEFPFAPTEGEILRGALCAGHTILQGAGRPDEAVHELRPPPETLLQGHHERHQQAGGAE